MKLKEGYQQEFQHLRSFLADLAHEISSTRAISGLIGYFEKGPGIALARIWTLGPGDRCDTCVLAGECRDRRLCLHLAGTTGPKDSLDTGRFSRVPVGHLKIGHAAASGDDVILTEDPASSPWVLHPEWVRREGIRGVAVLPLVHAERPLGVLAVFTRIALSEEALSWLRLIADHGGAALGRADTFRDLERRLGRLELENRSLDAAHPSDDIRVPGEARAPEDPAIRTYDELREDERANLERALARCGGKVSGPGGAAELLGIKPTTLASKIKALGISSRPAGRSRTRAHDRDTR